MTIEQLDLFAQDKPAPAPSGLVVLGEPMLNGFYYETRSRRFVSYVLGRRHYEILASRCKPPAWPRDWQKRMMEERCI